MDQLDPSSVCNFHCLRHETNQELIRLIKNPNDVEIVPEYDRFI